MKYTNRLIGMVEAIEDIEHNIESNQSQIDFHKGYLTENGTNDAYHLNAIEKYESAILVLQLALDYIKEIDIHALHEMDETQRSKVYDVIEINTEN